MNALGHLGWFSLYNWWQESFDADEKIRFKELYRPLGGTFDQLISGPGGYPSKHVVWFLTGVASFAQNKTDKIIAIKFLEKAEQLSDGCTIVDKHFMYHELIESHYKLREDNTHYELAKLYCRKQISISTLVRKAFIKQFGNNNLRHLGFQQLSVVLEKEGEFKNAIGVAEQALTEGWKGDWMKKLEKLKKKSHGT